MLDKRKILRYFTKIVYLSIDIVFIGILKVSKKKVSLLLTLNIFLQTLVFVKLRTLSKGNHTKKKKRFI